MRSELIIIVAGRFCQVVLSLISVRMMTTLLSTKEVGYIYLINSMTGLFGLFCIAPVSLYLTRRIHKWEQEKNILNNFFLFNIYTCVIALFSVLGIYMLNRVFNVGININLGLLCLFIPLTIVIGSWNALVIPNLNMLGHKTAFVVFTMLTLGIGLLASILLVTAYTSSAIFWLFGQLGAQLLITCIAYYFLKRHIGNSLNIQTVRKSINKNNIRNVLHYTAPLAVTFLFIWAQNQSYRIIIENRIGIEFLGFIGLGMSIASNIASAAETLIQQIYNPMFYKELNSPDPLKRTASVNKLLQLTLPVYVSLTIMVFCLAPFCVDILAHKKFYLSYSFVMFGALIELFRMTTGVLGNAAQSEMQTSYVIKAYFAGGTCAVGGVYFASFSPDYQYVIPFVLVMSGFLSTLIMYRQMKRLMAIKLGIKTILRSIAISTPFALAFCFYKQSRSLPLSLVIVSVSGLFFLGSQYLLAKPLLARNNAS